MAKISHFRELRVWQGGMELVEVSLRDACEFLSKKDYLDNWQSEMHETFCYWSFRDWRSAVGRRWAEMTPMASAVAPAIAAGRQRPSAISRASHTTAIAA